MTEACCPRPNAPPVLAPHGYPVEADGSVEARSVDGQQIFSYWVASSSNYTLLDKPSKNCRTCEISAIREFCCVDFNAFSPASSFASQSNKSRVAIKRLVFHQKCYNRYWPPWPIGLFVLRMLRIYPTPNNCQRLRRLPIENVRWTNDAEVTATSKKSDTINTAAVQTVQKMTSRRSVGTTWDYRFSVDQVDYFDHQLGQYSRTPVR